MKLTELAKGVSDRACQDDCKVNEQGQERMSAGVELGR